MIHGYYRPDVSSSVPNYVRSPFGDSKRETIISALQPECKYLALLDDNGKVLDYELIAFLENQLRAFEIVFFVQGNHEAYGTKVKTAVILMPITLLIGKILPG